MAMPAVVESPRFRNATGVPHDIIALPPPLKFPFFSEARGDARFVSYLLQKTHERESSLPHMIGATCGTVCREGTKGPKHVFWPELCGLPVGCLESPLESVGHSPLNELYLRVTGK